jgi:hypothetical protein
MLAACLLAACTTDPGGHLYVAYNDWDQPVVVELSMDRAVSVSLPARARATVSSSFAGPTTDHPWQVTVYDASCQALATLPLTSGHRTIHVDAAGAVQLLDSDSWSPPFPRVEPLPTLAAARCG